jgi:ABC-type Fe3+-siderophore transport system permease subunit
MSIERRLAVKSSRSLIAAACLAGAVRLATADVTAAVIKAEETTKN